MVKRIGLFCVLLALTQAAYGCGSAQKAPRTVDGQRIAIYVKLDRGTEGNMEEIENTERDELGIWMEKDLLAKLQDDGYEVHPIRSSDAFEATTGNYLLELMISTYIAGRHTPRIEAGFGEGVVTVQVDYKLHGLQNGLYHTVAKGRHAEVSARKWQYPAGQVNDKTLKIITKRISELN